MEEARAAMLSMCESPAEEAFVRGWFADGEWSARIRKPGLFELWDETYETAQLRYLIAPQHRVLRYRLDFLLCWSSPRQWNGCAIEIDGHAWHERTHAEAAAQRRRDRALLEVRILTVRFAAIEVLDDAAAAVFEAASIVQALEYDGMCAAETGIDERTASYGVEI